ncbi:MAG: ADOP family duplicated permease [Bryobacteraceae bacterium]
MSLWSRIANALHGDRLSREIDEEIRSHIEDAIGDGRDLAEARRAFGSVLSTREECRDGRIVQWLESLRADTVFGWRQLVKRKVTSAAAVLSLALAIGACTSAFRLIDALLLRPLPVAEPQRLYSLSRHGMGFDGKPQSFDGWAYPAFRLMRAAVKGQAELLAVSYALRMDLTYQSDQEMEKACVQYVSGWMFGRFGLRPSLGRLFTENDDLKLGAHPYAVLSYDYWTRRFGQDPKAIGRTFRLDDTLFQIVGVGPESFTGTETGTVTDIFLPTMMNPRTARDDATWHRTLARLNPGVAMEPVRARLHATSRAFEIERAKGFTGMTRRSIDRFIDQTLVLEPAAAGTSDLQQEYRRSLVAGGLLVALVLLIACANVANLMAAQAAARAREMALRVSIGAGRSRLVQLVMVESGMLAILAAAIGALFAWWSAPFVVRRISSPGNPVRLALPADWRVLGFGLALTLVVTLLFGLAPALRASAVKPARALKGGEDPHSRRRLMHVLIAVQVAFCFLVLFGAGLFAATFQRLSNRPIGFSPDRLLTLTVIPARPQPPVVWDQVANHLRAVPGVEKVALAGWPLLTRNSMNNFISTNGAPPGPVLAYFLPVSPGWLDTMRIPLVDGRDFRPEDTTPGAAIVNQTFVRQFFDGQNPVGKTFARGRNVYQVAGVVPDSPYRSLHEPILPVAYTPFRAIDATGAFPPISHAAFIVRTASRNPLALASTLRREVPRARSEFRVSDIGTQAELVAAQTIRERLLAMLALFFAVVALVLAGIGLYGVLDYSVLQRRREIGIRMAVGAQAGDIARRVTADVFRMVAAGAVAGVALGMATVRYIEALLYQVKPTDPAMLAPPALAILAVALVAALPAAVRAVRIDPARILRSE